MCCFYDHVVGNINPINYTAHARRNWLESNQLFGMIDNNVKANTLVKGPIIRDFD